MPELYAGVPIAAINLSRPVHRHPAFYKPALLVPKSYRDPFSQGADFGSHVNDRMPAHLQHLLLADGRTLSLKYCGAILREYLVTPSLSAP